MIKLLKKVAFALCLVGLVSAVTSLTYSTWKGKEAESLALSVLRLENTEKGISQYDRDKKSCQTELTSAVAERANKIQACDDRKSERDQLAVAVVDMATGRVRAGVQQAVRTLADYEMAVLKTHRDCQKVEDAIAEANRLVRKCDDQTAVSALQNYVFNENSAGPSYALGRNLGEARLLLPQTTARAKADLSKAKAVDETWKTVNVVTVSVLLVTWLIYGILGLLAKKKNDAQG